VSIYFGGGTPSLWDPSQVGRVLAACRDLFDVREGAEITLEANPGPPTRAASRRSGSWA